MIFIIYIHVHIMSYKWECLSAEFVVVVVVVVVLFCFSEKDYIAPCNCSSCRIFSITGNKYLGQNTDT